jgi:YYY domain-containing protein
MQEIIYSLTFYLVFMLFGLTGFAFLYGCIGRNKTLLYLISKPVGLAIIAFPVWILSSFRVLRFDDDVKVQLIVFIFSLLSFAFLTFMAYRRFIKNPNFFKENKGFFIKIIAVELATMLLYAIYLYIKSFNPNLEGTEKFMDLHLLMSAGKTDYFPFFDGWWAGKSVNYYYYGFYLFAFAAKFSGVPYAIAYNLSLGIIFVQTCLITGAICFRLVREYATSVVAAGLVGLAGNFHYALCYAQNLGDQVNGKCFYPKATRIYDPAYTINEITSYSFILGDLHPHFLSIPFFLLGIYLLVEIFQAKTFSIKLSILFAFIAATAGLINLWDFITLGILYAIIIAYKLLSQSQALKTLREKWSFIVVTLISTLQIFSTLYLYNFAFSGNAASYVFPALFFALGILCVILYLRVYQHRQSLIYLGILFTISAILLIYANWLLYLFLVGFGTVCFLVFLVLRDYLLKNIVIEKRFFGTNIFALALTAISPFIFYFTFFSNFKSPVTGIGFAPEYVRTYSAKFSDMQYPSNLWFLFGIWGSFLILSVVSLIVITLLRKYSFNKLFLPIAFIGLALGLIGFTELFFFQDLFHIANPPYFRANTVFKFTYHAWILMGIGTALLLHFSWHSLTKIKSLPLGLFSDLTYIILLCLVLGSVFLYPIIAVEQAFAPKLPWLMDENDKKLTLDGSKFIESRSPGDYETIQWINKNIKRRVVILEAVGGAYTYNARIGVHSGMGNIINWETHEWTWRFHYPENIKYWQQALLNNKASNDSSTSQEVIAPIETGYAEIAKTTAEVKTAYETTDIEATKEILKKYNVEYVYIGSQERVNYPDIQEAKFKSLGELVFESNDSKLYKVYE